MDMLTRITIQGYRSIKDADIELAPLNVLIGPNGAGKSNLISFFKMLNETMGGRMQKFIAANGRAQSMLHYGPKVTPRMEARLTFEVDGCVNTYDMRLFHAAGDSLVFAGEELAFQQSNYPQPKVLELGAGHMETRIPEKAEEGEPMAKFIHYLLHQCRVYHFHDTSPTARMRQYAYIGDTRFLMPDAGNIAAMLYAYRQSSGMVYERIVSAIGKVVPEFDDFILEPDRANPRDIILNWRRQGSDYVLGPHQLSDGSLRAIAMITLFLQPEADLPGLIVLDEPELGLHPHALEIVAGLMRAAAQRTQVLVATQSQTFLNHFEPSEVLVVESNGGGSQYRRLGTEELHDWLQDYTLGELWQRNVLGAGPLP